jgi:acyl dehydratase
MRSFDDFAVGEIINHGSRVITAEDIVAFAAEFDPQPFHLDPGAPEAAFTGGLIASGWHLGVIFMRLMCDSMLIDSTSMGSPGIDTLKWLKPARPGDELTARSIVLSARPSNSRPDRGIVHFRHELANSAGDTVMRFDNPIMFGRRR